MANYYNLNELKQIPIVQVAKTFGCEIKENGNKCFTKIRSEETPSVCLYKDTNTYYDFGNAISGGDTISLVAYILNIENTQAIEVLANAFNIEPIKKTRNFKNKINITEEEVKFLGLNYDEINRFNLKYLKLQEQHKKEYVALLENKAIPFVQNYKAMYFKEVYTTDLLAKESDINLLDITDLEELENFANMVSYTDYLMSKIIEPVKEDIKYYPQLRNVKDDILNIRNGFIAVQFGNVLYNEIKEFKEELFYKKISYEVFKEKIYYKIEPTFLYSAFIKNNEVNICCKAKDKEILLSAINTSQKHNINNNIYQKNIL